MVSQPCARWRGAVQCGGWTLPGGRWSTECAGVDVWYANTGYRIDRAIVVTYRPPPPPQQPAPAPFCSFAIYYLHSPIENLFLIQLTSFVIFCKWPKIRFRSCLSSPLKFYRAIENHLDPSKVPISSSIFCSIAVTRDYIPFEEHVRVVEYLCSLTFTSYRPFLKLRAFQTYGIQSDRSQILNNYLFILQ